MSNKDTALAQPLKIGSKIAKNRFAIQPMECADSRPDGGFSERSIERYSNLFEGGAGVIVFESITLQRDFIARTNQLSLNINDKKSIQEWVSRLKQCRACRQGYADSD